MRMYFAKLGDMFICKPVCDFLASTVGRSSVCTAREDTCDEF